MQFLNTMDMQMKISAQRMIPRAFGIIGIKTSAERWKTLERTLNVRKENLDMEQETLYNILSGGYGEILETHAMWGCIAALGIKPFKDGNQWCFLYGDNIQEGICGFGETIFKAAWNFYTNIKTEVAKRW